MTVRNGPDSLHVFSLPIGFMRWVLVESVGRPIRRMSFVEFAEVPALGLGIRLRGETHPDQDDRGAGRDRHFEDGSPRH